MRAATYSIPLAAGDQGIAECVVNYLAPDRGRRRSQHRALARSGSGRRRKPATAKIDKRTVRGMPITVIDTSGTYTGMGGPMAGVETGCRVPADRRDRRRARRQRVLQTDGSGENDRRAAEKFRATARVDSTRQVIGGRRPHRLVPFRVRRVRRARRPARSPLAARRMAAHAGGHLGRTGGVHRLDLPADTAGKSFAPRQGEAAIRAISLRTTFCLCCTRTG